MKVIRVLHNNPLSYTHNDGNGNERKTHTVYFNVDSMVTDDSGNLVLFRGEEVCRIVQRDAFVAADVMKVDGSDCPVIDSHISVEDALKEKI